MRRILLRPPTQLAVGCVLLLQAPGPAWPQNEVPGTSIQGFTQQLGPLTVTVGPVRIIARQARTPQVASFADGTQVLTGGNPFVSTNVRSEDGAGVLWKENPIYFGYLNSEELANGTLFVLDYQVTPLGNEGIYRTQRWTSADQGLSLQGPFNGRARIPPGVVSPNAVTWFNQVIEDTNGALLAVAQSQEIPGQFNGPWKVTLLRSEDGGVRFDYVATVADQTTIVDPGGELTEHNWPLYWATEPAIVALGNDRLVSVMRTTNDEDPNNLLPSHVGPPMDTYTDLQHTVKGDEIAPSLGLELDPEKWYSLGAPNAKLIIAVSNDGGETWGAAGPMPRPRGVFPRLAWDGSGILALAYGGLSGVPRHGNAIAFSLDQGATWSAEVNFAPFLTTGYTALTAIGPGQFLAFFDASPPQPWTKHEQWWIGVRTISVALSSE